MANIGRVHRLTPSGLESEPAATKHDLDLTGGFYQLALAELRVTVRDNPGDIRNGLLLGADGYITKPYSKQLLVDTIRKVLVQEPPAAA